MHWANFFAPTRRNTAAGRQISRTACRNTATLKPTPPPLTPNKGPLKPPSPLRPKNAPKTPISHPQRRRWFQTTGPPRLQHPHAAPVGGGTRTASRRRDKPPINNPAPLVWRTPAMPDCGARGRWILAGLRDDAPSEARGADGSRAGRHPPARTAAGPDDMRVGTAAQAHVEGFTCVSRG